MRETQLDTISLFHKALPVPVPPASPLRNDWILPCFSDVGQPSAHLTKLSSFPDCPPVLQDNCSLTWKIPGKCQ